MDPKLFTPNANVFFVERADGRERQMWNGDDLLDPFKLCAVESAAKYKERSNVVLALLDCGHRPPRVSNYLSGIASKCALNQEIN